MKKKKIIIILIIICLFILIVSGIIYSNLKKNVNQADLDPKEDNVLNLSGFGIFFDKYTGDLKSSEIAKGLEKIVTDQLPNMYNEVKNYNDDKLEKYYDENKMTIKRNYGIKNLNSFKTFIYAIRNSGVNLKQWYRLDIVTDKFVDKSDYNNYAYAEFTVSYKDDKELKFSLYVSKLENVNPTYMISIIE